MCGRFIIYSEAEEQEIISIVEEVNQKYKNDALSMKMGEIAPADTVPVVIRENGRMTASLFKWGFPNYKSNGVLINARGETVDTKPMFMKSLVSKRCLIPANGFFEWKRCQDKKEKHIIKPKRCNFFYMAGLYNNFIDNNGKPFLSFVIITVPANEEMASIHDRMPVILTNRNDINIWLDEGVKDTSVLKSILKPYSRELVIEKAV